MNRLHDRLTADPWYPRQMQSRRMTQQLSALKRLSLLVLLACIAACDESPSELQAETCVPQRSEACACLGGMTGVQTCLDDGTFAPCDCPESEAREPSEDRDLPRRADDEEPRASSSEEPVRDREAEAEAEAEPEPERDGEPEPEGYQGPWLQITEWMATNRDTLKDEDGDSSDWIEIHNPSDTPINLAGYHLSDDEDAPGRWTFPAYVLEAKGFLVVFASGKDRRDPEAPLHTDFKLSASGEHLSLSAPDGTILDVQADWPPQVRDVAFGVKMAQVDDSLIGPSATGRYLMPYGAEPDWSWTVADWSPQAEVWTYALLGLGYEGDADSALEEPVADSISDWSGLGTQGEFGWEYGYFDASEGLGVYDPSEMTYFSEASFNGSEFAWPMDSGISTMLGQELCHPNGTNSGVEHWVVRRWTASMPGTLVVQWRLAKEVTGGKGVTGRVMHEGVEVDSAMV